MDSSLKFLSEILWYVSLMAVPHLILFVLGCFVVVLRNRMLNLNSSVKKWGFFVACLLFCGGVWNAVWSSCVYGQLYISRDYLLDFSPFWPITEKVINREFANQKGVLIGVTLAQLNFVWIVFSLGTFFTSWLGMKFLSSKERGHREGPVDCGFE